jgi:hypothetical protein
MLPAPLAELLQFDAVRGGLPVFRFRVIAFFAITALNRNDFSGHKTQLLAHNLFRAVLLKNSKLHNRFLIRAD